MPVGLDKLLLCGKCHQQYDLSSRRPKLLVCHHCFCMQCIQTFIKTKSNQTASCPTCSKTTCIGKNGVATLPDNEYLLPQVRAQSKQHREQQHLQKVTKKEPEYFVSDSSSDEEVSEEESYEAAYGYTEATSTPPADTFFNGAVAAATSSTMNGERVRIFCQTCMAVATQQCVSNHDICNYDTGINVLIRRLEEAVQGAGENLVSEVNLLEETNTRCDRLQKALATLNQDMEQSVVTNTMSLTAAKSSLDKLPDPKLGVQAAKVGDPSTLARAVTEVEHIRTNSGRRLQNIRNTANIWRALQNCNVNVQTAIQLPLTQDGLLFPIELNQRVDDDTVGMLFALSKLIEKRIIISQQPESSNANKKTPNATNTTKTSTKEEWMQIKNGRQAEGRNPHLNTEPELPTKKISRSVNSGIKFCYFDLVQGHGVLGRIIMEINCKAAPKMSKNFIELCTGLHGFGYLNTKLWRISTGDHVDGGDIPEGGQCSIFDKQPFFGDASPLQDGLGMLRMRGRGTAQDGQAIVGSQFMIWIKARKFKNYARTLVFGKVTEGLELLTNMPETRQRKGKPFVPPVAISQCGVLD